MATSRRLEQEDLKIVYKLRDKKSIKLVYPIGFKCICLINAPKEDFLIDRDLRYRDCIGGIS